MERSNSLVDCGTMSVGLSEKAAGFGWRILVINCDEIWGGFWIWVTELLITMAYDNCGCQGGCSTYGNTGAGERVEIALLGIDNKFSLRATSSEVGSLRFIAIHVSGFFLQCFYTISRLVVEMCLTISFIINFIINFIERDIFSCLHNRLFILYDYFQETPEPYRIPKHKNLCFNTNRDSQMLLFKSHFTEK